jgi:hypothetical protein
MTGLHLSHGSTRRCDGRHSIHITYHRKGCRQCLNVNLHLFFSSILWGLALGLVAMLPVLRLALPATVEGSMTSGKKREKEKKGK